MEYINIVNNISYLIKFLQEAQLLLHDGKLHTTEVKDSINLIDIAKTAKFFHGIQSILRSNSQLSHFILFRDCLTTNIILLETIQWLDDLSVKKGKQNWPKLIFANKEGRLTIRLKVNQNGIMIRYYNDATFKSKTKIKNSTTRLCYMIDNYKQSYKR